VLGWGLAGGPDVHELVEEVEPEGRAQGEGGGGDEQSQRLEPEVGRPLSGRGTAVLKLQRPWEAADRSAEEFRFDVVAG
jgi:hypothetical protein